jgi:hypothetical protein
VGLVKKQGDWARETGGLGSRRTGEQADWNYCGSPSTGTGEQGLIKRNKGTGHWARSKATGLGRQVDRGAGGLG